MAEDFNASLVISTAQAVTNVRNLDSATKDLDQTLAHLHTTMQASQGDIDKVAKSLKVFTDTQRQQNRDAKERNQTLISGARLEREQIVNRGKAAEVTNKQAMAEAKLSGIRARNNRGSISGLGNETRRNAESDARIASVQAQTQARLATEGERRAAQEHRTAAAIAQRSAAEARNEMTSLRLAQAQERNRNANLALNDSLSNSRYLLYDVGATYATLSAILLALPVATTAVAASFEKDFTQVIRTAGLVGEEIPAAFDELRQLGKEIPMTFAQFANIGSIAGQLGIAKEELGAFTETVAKFGAASNVGIDEAATAFGRLENSFNQNGQTEDFFNKVGSAIAKVGVESAASETEIIAVTNQISAAGSQFGFTADQIVGLSGALASVRIRPELARGAFQRILLDLSRAADEGSEAFDKFAKYTNQTGQAAIDLFKNNPSQFFQEYIAGIKGTISAGNSVSSVLDDIGAKNVFDKQFILGLANGLDVYNKAMSDSADAFEKGSFLNESTKATFETFAATIQKIGNALAGLGARLGGGTLQPLTELAEIVLNSVNAFDRLIDQTPALGVVLNGLLAFGTVTGVFLALKSAQAFVLAGLVGLQQVMGKASIAGALTLKGNVSELAKTMLMAKGASASLAAGLLQNKTAFQQLSFAASATSASLARYATVSNTAAAGSGALVTRTAAAGAAVRTMGTAMLGVVGGPIGAIVLGLASVVAQLISTDEKAKQAGDSIARAFKNGGDAGNRAIGEALTDRTVDSFNPNETAAGIGDHGKNVRKIAEEVGISFDQIVASIAKGSKAGEDFNGVLNQLAQNKGYANWAEMSGNSMDDNAAKANFLKHVVEDLGSKSAESGKDQTAVANAADKLGQSANQAAPSVEGLGEGIEGVGDKAGETTDKIKAAVDAIFGFANAEVAVQDSLGRLGESIYKSGSMGSGDAGGRENISNFQDVLRNAAVQQQQLIDSGEQTIQQASLNYTTFINSLMNEMASKGVDVSQVMAMANQAKTIFGATLDAGGQPTMQVKVDDSAVDAAKNYLDWIVAEYGTTNISVILKEGGSQQVADNVSRLTQYVDAATGEPYTVNVDGDNVQAFSAVNETISATSEAFGVPFTAIIDANADPFTQTMQWVQQFAASVVNNIIDMINNLNNFVDTIAPGLTNNVQREHVSWGMPESQPAKTAPAVPTVPSVGKGTSGGGGGDQKKQFDDNMAGLDGLTNGYNDAAQAAEKAGEKGKKAGEDAANGIDDATQSVNDYADRLRQGLQSAFDQQYRVQTALDAYHTTLNSIKKKREDEVAQVAELLAKQKELNNARKEDLTTARKAGIEKAISLKYGEGDRAADYANQEQTALDNAAAKQKDAEATKKQADEIQAGIGKLDGYSQAAIDNRAALRDLESKMLDVVGAYASTGLSVDQVKAKARQLTAQFKTDVTQLGYNKGAVQGLRGEMDRYIAKIGQVPRVKPTTVSADTAGAKSGIDGIRSALNNIPKNTTYRVTQEKVTKSWYMGSIIPTPNTTKAGDRIYRVVRPDGTNTTNMLFNRGGLVPGFASGGLIPGQAPSDPRKDNLLASVDGKGQVMVRSGEFIVQQPAVDYWGLDFFKNLNNMRMPAFNAGGSVGGGRSGGGAGAGGPVLVELTAENIAAIQRLPQINLYADSTKIAESAAHGNMILASQGAN